MSVRGYAGTSVADIVRNAGVSRQTFYELFDSKQSCFLASYERRQDSLIEAIFSTPVADAPIDRFASFLGAYLSVIASRPETSKLYLIGVYSAGPEAVAIKLDKQKRFVDGVADVFDARTDAARFACRTLVGAISTLVVDALLADEVHSIENLHGPLVDVARKMFTA
ncbi:TetR/AcrR family transcriptional regulator [Mycobacterium yunnanensis]|uniref:TetR/AcrR family transcriptional regulator n=2 Tax=Mycobacterium yunnanensis TaxID=368477 RepID=A0A9X2YZ16_9MYCO|nr:TetR/AcrR family transcriptional regulator [Mycobacterium yunnanensis]